MTGWSAKAVCNDVIGAALVVLNVQMETVADMWTTYDGDRSATNPLCLYELYRGRWFVWMTVSFPKM
jgi:hypothetical protein